MALGSTQPLTEMSTRSISWGKGGRCVRLTTYHHPAPLSRDLGTLTSWNPLGHSGPVTGDCFTFTCFDLLISHLQAYLVGYKVLCTNWDPSVCTGLILCILLMYTLGSQYVHSTLWLNLLNRPEDDWSISGIIKQLCWCTLFNIITVIMAQQSRCI